MSTSEPSPPPRGNYFAAWPVTVPEDFLPSLRVSAPPHLRWFHPGDLHVTLAFLGSEIPARIPDLQKILAGIELPLGEITLGPLVSLPSERHPSALSFTVANGNEDLAGLIAQWRPLLLEAAGYRPDPRPPLPHLTVARPPRKKLAPCDLKQWLASVSPPPEPVILAPPVLYGWSAERPKRQFHIIPVE